MFVGYIGKFVSHSVFNDGQKITRYGWWPSRNIYT